VRVAGGGSEVQIVQPRALEFPLSDFSKAITLADHSGTLVLRIHCQPGGSAPVMLAGKKG
jgi:hypothetical protein